MKKSIKKFSITFVVVALIVIIPSIVKAASGVKISVSNCSEYNRTNHYLFVMPRANSDTNGGSSYEENVKIKHNLDMDEGWEIVNQYPNTDTSSAHKQKLVNVMEMFSRLSAANLYDGTLAVQDGNDYYFRHGESCVGNCFNDNITALLRNESNQLSSSDLAELKQAFANSIYFPTGNDVVIASDFTQGSSGPTNITRLNEKNFIKSGVVTVDIYRKWGDISSLRNLNMNYFKHQAGMEINDPGYGKGYDKDVCPNGNSNNTSCEAYVVVDYVVELERKECSYTVTYDGDSEDAKNVPNTQKKDEGKCITLSSQIPTRSGYTFQYWIDDENNRYDPGDKYCIDENLDLKAVWENNKTGDIVTPDNDGKDSDNDVKSPGTGVGIAYGLIAAVVLGSTIAIIYVRRRNKFENI